MDFVFAGTSELKGLVTAGGRPVRAVELRITPHVSGGVTAYDTTTETGNYMVRGIADGRHRIRMRTGHLFEVDVFGGTTFNIELPSTSLSGRIFVDQTSTPVRGGSVTIQRIELPGASRVLLRTETASDGSFFFDGLVAGEYELRASHPGLKSVSRQFEIRGDKEVELFLVNVKRPFFGRSQESSLVLDPDKSVATT